MRLLERMYLKKHPGASESDIPYWYRRSIMGEIWHILRKWICQVLAPNCVTNTMRIGLYRLCGFKIGKGSFIGMKCYLDDLCIDKLIIQDHVTISYGVYFACHGRGQGHNRIVIEDHAYIGMRCSIIARNDNMKIGHHSVVGANSLVNKDIPAYGVAYGSPARVQRIQKAIDVIEEKVLKDLV